MPIEIKELLIKVEVPDQNTAKDATHKPSSFKIESAAVVGMPDDWLDQITELLKNKKER